EDSSVLANIFEAAVERLPKGQDAVEEAASEVTAVENSIFKRKLGYINLAASLAPMLGLMGTISGMIKAFDAMATEGAIGDPAKLSGDIGEALITTFGGLLVAVPSMAIFFILQNRLQGSFVKIQSKIASFISEIDFDNIPGDLVIGDKPVGTDSMQAFSTRASAVKSSTTKAETAEDTVGCPTCSQPIAVGAEKCPHCGTEMSWE
ncbi:MAG: hypothetical protein GX811_06895, partial [Lentisphaerae bacterium]|nr:hypothetical protein [Lentisphaerota bacterium]